MPLPSVDELVRPLVVTHGLEMDQIARIKLSRRIWKIRFFVSEGGRERELKLTLCPGALTRLAEEVRKRGTEFADEIASRLFRHAGFEMDRVEHFARRETEWFRK